MKNEDIGLISRWSAAMGYVCIIAAVTFIGGSIWQWHAMSPSELASWLNVPSIRLDHGRDLAVLLLMGLPALINAYGLMQIRSSFLSFASGEMFSSKVILGLQRFGSAGMSAVLLSAILTPLVGFFLTYDSAAGADFPIRIGTGSLTILVISGFTWTFARILSVVAAIERRNKELAEENAAFV
ncbi:hypothetical protein AEAC466_05240 [Asticcacaulis sp. AC466]|uniref:DUF2975 domain-containing protein n=1 Tax=Asticcacaulis sp. AC466 TaxID=1282362 RepID=UPI0003C3DC24|nr:DUF2975 domain-containing protein [Asticcacaulis sp. AC466]ESQ85116.1 hypothetical protein AEAC466_05240 [Asticcacaulis sp. AC466]